MCNLYLFIMKNYFLFLLGLSFFMFVSCEKDDDHHDECHECHLEILMANGTIDNSTDIGEFCGDDLHDVEENGWTVNEEFSFDGVTYEVGHLFTADQVHCEEHADHDDHDHD